MGHWLDDLDSARRKLLLKNKKGGAANFDDDEAVRKDYIMVIKSSTGDVGVGFTGKRSKDMGKLGDKACIGYDESRMRQKATRNQSEAGQGLLGGLRTAWHNSYASKGVDLNEELDALVKDVKIKDLAMSKILADEDGNDGAIRLHPPLGVARMSLDYGTSPNTTPTAQPRRILIRELGSILPPPTLAPKRGGERIIALLDFGRLDYLHGGGRHDLGSILYENGHSHHHILNTK